MRTEKNYKIEKKMCYVVSRTSTAQFRMFMKFTLCDATSSMIQAQIFFY